MIGVNKGCYLEEKFYINDIVKPNALIKNLDLRRDDIIEVNMTFENCCYGKYITIWNTINDKVAREFSFKKFINMIGVNFEIVNY